MTRLSIVILTSNQYRLTERCVEALKDFSRLPDYEIILVDNGSTDGTAERIPHSFPWVKYIHLSRNMGVAYGRNTGVAAAGGELIMLLDNDTIATPETILQLENYFRSHPECGVLAPRLVDSKGDTQESFKDFPGIGLKIRNWLYNRKDNIPRIDTKKILEPFYVIGAAQMFLKADFEKVGGLDSRIFFGPEDADFCMAVRYTGKRIVYHPGYTIVHDYQRSTSARKLTRQTFRHMKAMLYFYCKHRRFV